MRTFARASSPMLAHRELEVVEHGQQLLERALRWRARRARSARGPRACGSSRSRPAAGASCRATRRARAGARQGRLRTARSRAITSSASSLGSTAATASTGSTDSGAGVAGSGTASSDSCITLTRSAGRRRRSRRRRPRRPRAHPRHRPARRRPRRPAAPDAFSYSRVENSWNSRRAGSRAPACTASMSVPAKASFNALERSPRSSSVSSAETLSPCSFSSCLGLVDERVGGVADLRLLALALVLLRVRLGVLDHLVDVVLAERGAAGDRHRLLLARAEILGADTCTMPFASMSKVTSICGTPRGAGGRPVSVNVPSGLLRYAMSLSPCSTLISTDRLVVVGRRERLRLLRRDRGVALDELRHDLALGLDAERQRRDVEEQDVLDVTLQHTGLDRRAERDGLVGVDALVRVLAGQLAHEVARPRACGSNRRRG